MKKIQVLIVEDSRVIRTLLEHIVGRDARLEVLASVESAEDALAILERHSPDVIAMDIRLPGIDGLEATRRIMSQRPIPIVVVAASVESRERNSVTMEALRAGALTVLEKPVGTTHGDYEKLADRLCTQLVIMSQVRLVRQYIRREPQLTLGCVPRPVPRGRATYRMLGIACSTGGPGALVQLLQALGPAFPLPILLVQHLTASFIEGFASWLASVCPFSVVIVKDGCTPAAHTVHMPPAERHLLLDGGRLRLGTGDPICFQRPSGTVLFQSMARDLGAGALGVLLTGMGEDGALGLLDIHHAGGYTVAEDESTAIVYGMPGAAVGLGAVRESLPLPDIGPRIRELTLCKSKQEVA